MTNLDRESLFANETLVIGMLQAVAGGSIVASLAQADVIIQRAGQCSFLIFVTLAALSLVLAILAAYWKHQYKMWDVKAGASDGEATYHKYSTKNADQEAKYAQEAESRRQRANRYLSAMRRAIGIAIVSLVLGIGLLVAGLWYIQIGLEGDTAARQTASDWYGHGG